MAAAARAKVAKDEEAPAAPTEEAATAAASRAPKAKTAQPWKVAASRSARGFVPRPRTPRKVGGG